jgi:hypothetical protein
MPTGDGQERKRRGKYARCTKAPRSSKWTRGDKEHCNQLEIGSPLLNQTAKHLAAVRATELSRQLRELDGRARTVDEEKALIAASSQYRKWLEMLRVTERVKEDDTEF